MGNTSVLLVTVKNIAQEAVRMLCRIQKDDLVGEQYSYSPTVPREMKAKVDQIMEEIIINQLIPLGIPILSEERGYIFVQHDGDGEEKGLKLIVDPLDGTVNYMRGLGSASVSIALYRWDQPIFGVLGLWPSGDLVWGGKDMGAFLNEEQIRVSSISDPVQSVLCTGIPSRMNLDQTDQCSKLMCLLRIYGKVRMLGAASLSLLQVAQGSAEIYSEQEIMLWDVAAGLALVEGAGGKIMVLSGESKNSLNVVATNGVIN